MNLMKAIGQRLIVKVNKEKEKIENGIIVPTKSTERYETGVIVDLGNNFCYNLKTGITIYFEKNSGIDVMYEEEEYRVLKLDDILSYICKDGDVICVPSVFTGNDGHGTSWSVSTSVPVKNLCDLSPCVDCTCGEKEDE